MDEESRMIREIAKGLLRWYDFQEGSRVLYLGKPEEALAELLREMGLSVVCREPLETMDEGWATENRGSFQYVVVVLKLEEQKDPVRYLKAWRELLTRDGRFLLGMNNRLGVRYFCGDRDPYTDRNYDGIENYRGRVSEKGRCYSRHEIKEMLRESGCPAVKLYSVLPDLEHPQLIYAEDALPNEELSSRLFPMYHNPGSVFLKEEYLYTDMAENDLFHAMANAFLAECPAAAEAGFSDVKHVTLASERGESDACMTIIHGKREMDACSDTLSEQGISNGSRDTLYENEKRIVEKRAMYPQGKRRITEIAENLAALRSHGIDTVDFEIRGDSLLMPYVEAENVQSYLKRLLSEDKDSFIGEVDRFRDMILASSEHIREDGSARVGNAEGVSGKVGSAEGDNGEVWSGKEDSGEVCSRKDGTLLKRGYLDLVPLNSFYLDGKYVVYDQEFCMENCPANLVIMRMLCSLYFGNDGMEKLLPVKFFFDRYEITPRLDYWRKVELDFIIRLRREQELYDYHMRNRRNDLITPKNRLRMNFSEEEYQRRFVDIFRNAEKKKLLLFGSGQIAARFLALYRREYEVSCLLDNDSSKWGSKLYEIPIQPPSVLKNEPPGECRVIICIRDYLPVMRQLEEMGVKDYCVYEPERDYPRQRRLKLSEQNDVPKKYHIGYTAGVFDLFHIGHLNLLKRSKEMCDYLIVGVVTDEHAFRMKGKKPFIPFEERLEIVRGCRYVDEAVEVPTEYPDIHDAYGIYHFDCQFSGNDHAENPHWLAQQKYLRERGSDLYFFPYTQGTSSTMLQEAMRRERVVDRLTMS